MVALVSTLHDPDGRMVDATTRVFREVAGLYESVAIVPTADTSPRLLDLLAGANVDPISTSNGAIGVGRRHALELGLLAGANHLHYCDFDRILHWTAAYPDELERVLRRIEGCDYLIIGRTERAFATHPRVQRDTESITNRAFSLWYGKTVDVTAGSCGLSRRAADLVLRESAASTNATDAEWPALVRIRGSMPIDSVRTEGLEFETADYFAEEIAAAGSLEAWLEERSRPLDAWVARTRLALESLEAVQRLTTGHLGDP